MKNISQFNNMAMKKTALTEICIALLILLFAYTAVSKFLDYEKFVFQMRLAPLPMMRTIAPILGWLMPTIEIVIAVGLLMNKFRKTALFSSVILLILFEIYITGMLLSGQHLPCTCGGIISTMSWKQHLGFNALFILIGVTAIKQTKKNSLDPSEKKGKIDVKDLSRA
jgi:putative oxidoreductase